MHRRGPYNEGFFNGKMTIERPKPKMLNPEGIKIGSSMCSDCGDDKQKTRVVCEVDRSYNELTVVGNFCDPCLEKRHEGVI